jgi:hypothetical protein
MLCDGFHLFHSFLRIVLVGPANTLPSGKSGLVDMAVVANEFNKQVPHVATTATILSEQIEYGMRLYASVASTAKAGHEPLEDHTRRRAFDTVTPEAMFQTGFSSPIFSYSNCNIDRKDNVSGGRGRVSACFGANHPVDTASSLPVSFTTRTRTSSQREDKNRR